MKTPQIHAAGCLNNGGADREASSPSSAPSTPRAFLARYAAASSRRKANVDVTSSTSPPKAYHRS